MAADRCGRSEDSRVALGFRLELLECVFRTPAEVLLIASLSLDRFDCDGLFAMLLMAPRSSASLWLKPSVTDLMYHLGQCMLKAAIVP